jgi:ATP synthase (F/14-kDa) subunit
MGLRRDTQVAEKIRPTVDKYHQTFPTVLEIPSKDHPYGKNRLLIVELWSHAQSARPIQGLYTEARPEVSWGLRLVSCATWLNTGV